MQKQSGPEEQRPEKPGQQESGQEQPTAEPMIATDYNGFQAVENPQEPEQTSPLQMENPIKSILNHNSPDNSGSRPEIHVKDHLRVLQRNTASSVVELRKMMFQNIQKIRQALSDESA